MEAGGQERLTFSKACHLLFRFRHGIFDFVHQDGALTARRVGAPTKLGLSCSAAIGCCDNVQDVEFWGGACALRSAGAFQRTDRVRRPACVGAGSINGHS